MTYTYVNGFRNSSFRAFSQIWLHTNVYLTAKQESSIPLVVQLVCADTIPVSEIITKMIAPVISPCRYDRHDMSLQMNLVYT